MREAALRLQAPDTRAAPAAPGTATIPCEAAGRRCRNFPHHPAIAARLARAGQKRFRRLSKNPSLHFQSQTFPSSPPKMKAAIFKAQKHISNPEAKILNRQRPNPRSRKGLHSDLPSASKAQISAPKSEQGSLVFSRISRYETAAPNPRRSQKSPKFAQ